MANEMNLGIIVIGDSGVGKSCLIQRFLWNKFTENHVATVGMSFYMQNLIMGDREAHLSIWDAAGKDTWYDHWPAYKGNTVGVWLVYDITNYQSYHNIRQWYMNIIELVNTSTVFLLVGNKSDLHGNRKVNTEEARRFAKSYGFLHIETSALQNENINKGFEALANAVYKECLGSTYFSANERTTSHSFSSISIQKPNSPKKAKRNCCAGPCIWPWKWPPW